MLFSLRILSTSLSAGEYAMFIVLVGLIGWFALCDGGAGHAVQNAVTKKLAAGRSADEEIVCAYVIQLIIAIFIVAILFVFREVIAAQLLSKIPSAVSQARETIFFQSAVVLVAGAAATLSTKILYAMHRGYVANACTALAAGASVFILKAGLSTAEYKVTFAVLALFGPIALVGLTLGAHQFLRSLKSRPRIRMRTMEELIASSKGFLLFHFIAAAVLQIDYIVMSQKIDQPTEIITYYSLAKIFALVAFFNEAILFAAWPRMTSLYTQGALAEIRVMLRRLVFYGAALTLLATLVVFVARDFISAIIVPGTSIEFHPAIIAGFGALALLRCLTDPFAIFLQSIGRTKILIKCAAVQALLGFGFQWHFSEIFGIGGILLALVLGFAVTAAWVLPFRARKILAGSP